MLKNIVSQTEFKKLFENQKIRETVLFDGFPINESLDFSNNTGFSTSLVGRIINKTFSFAAKYVEYAKLSKYGDEFKSELEKALQYASSLISVSNKSKTTTSTTTTTTVQEEEKTTISNIVSSVISIIVSMSISHGRYLPGIAIKTLNLNNQQQDDLKEIYDLVRVNELKKLEKINKNEPIEQKNTTKEPKTEIIMFKKSNNIDDNIKNQIMSIKTIVDKINPSELSETDINAIPTIIKNLENEKNILNSDENKKTVDGLLNKLKAIIKDKATNNLSDEEFKTKIKEYEDFSNKYNTSLIKILQDEFSKVSNWYKEVTTDKDGNELQDMKNKYKKLYHNISIKLHPDKVQHNSVIENLLNLQEVRELLNSQNIVLEMRNIIENYMKVFEKYNMVFEETALATTNNTNTALATTNNTNTALATTNNKSDDNTELITTKTNELIKSFSKEQEDEIILYFNNRSKDESLNINIKINISDKPEIKEFFKKKKTTTTTTKTTTTQGDGSSSDKDNYICENKGRDALNGLNDEEKTKFIKLAIDSVNNERLKVFALKAEMLYNKENYKSAKHEIYSRVNFSTTHPDQDKIKSKWLKILSTVKAEYMWCFSTNGTWPKTLDPIGLINSDVAMRENFSEYGANAKTILHNNGGIIEDSESDDKTLKNLRLSDGIDINDNDKLMLLLFDNDNSKLGLVVKSHSISNFITYSIYGYIIYDELLTALNKKFPDSNSKKELEDINEIKSLISSVHIKQYSDIDNIKTGDKEVFKKQFTTLANNQSVKNNILIRNNENTFDANKFTVTYDNKKLNIVKILKDKSNNYQFESLSDNFDTVTDYKNHLKISKVYGISDIKAWNNIIVKNKNAQIVKIIDNIKDKIDILIKK